MDLFTIQCTTCNARLVVRDESAVGDILACPKCNSMVQVVPPPGWKRPDSDPESAAADSSLGDLYSSKIPPIPSAAPTPPKKKAAAAIPPALPVRKPEPAAEVTSTTEAVAEPAEVVETSAAEPSEAEVAVETPSRFAALTTGVRKDWLVLGGGLVAGVMLGATAWFVVWLQTPAPQPAVVAQVPVAKRTSPAIVAEPESEQAAPTEEPPSANPPEPVAADAEPTENATSTPAPEVAAEQTEQTPVASEPTPAEPAVEVVEAEPPAPPADKPPALKLEPIAANKPLPLGDADATTAEPSLTESAPTDAATTEPVDSDAGDASDEFLVKDSPGESSPLASAQIEQRLAVPLAEVQFARVPLAQFAAFVGDVTGVRVVLDEDSLKAAGKNRKTPIEVRLSRTTALATLQAASRQAGLSYRIEDGRIVIAAAAR